MNKKIILWDMDGTLADATWRLPLIKEKPKNWKKFMADSIKDSPIAQTQLIFNLFSSREDISNWILTARSEDEREITHKWLEFHGFDYDVMHMRKSKDYRPDWEVKSEIVDGIRNAGAEIFMAFDDRPNVVKNCYVEKGIFVFDVGNGRTE